MATGQPVGSFVLAQKSSEKLSSASIRNICAELENEGYLTHPHTSAGRVPTDKGYRYYVDNLMVTTVPSRAEAARITEHILDRDSQISLERLMERTSQLLSELSGNVGIVVSPLITQEKLQHIDFVKLSDSRVLVITVSHAGHVQDRAIRIDVELSQDELNSTARYLTENFAGWTLPEIRDELMQRMSEAQAFYDKFLQNAVLLCSNSFADGDQPDVFIEGASNIIARPDFVDLEALRGLFKMLEQRSKIVKILNECIAGGDLEAVAVRIGKEHRVSDLRDCSIIASSCLYAAGNAVGSIGVVGPMRLDYDRLVGIVRYVARLFEQALNPTNAYR